MFEMVFEKMEVVLILGIILYYILVVYNNNVKLSKKNFFYSNIS